MKSKKEEAVQSRSRESLALVGIFVSPVTPLSSVMVGKQTSDTHWHSTRTLIIPNVLRYGWASVEKQTVPSNADIGCLCSILISLWWIWLYVMLCKERELRWRREKEATIVRITRMHEWKDKRTLPPQCGVSVGCEVTGSLLSHSWQQQRGFSTTWLKLAQIYKSSEEGGKKTQPVSKSACHRAVAAQRLRSAVVEQSGAWHAWLNEQSICSPSWPLAITKADLKIRCLRQRFTAHM